jgi:hypothetical protein
MRFYSPRGGILEEVARHLFGDVSNVEPIPEVGPNRMYTLDWVLAKFDSATGSVLDYHGVEVQAIDITGSVRPYFEAFLAGENWRGIRHPHGLNWSNVFKRLLPQFLAKGAMLHSFGKKLAIIVQDQLIDSVLRTGRMKFEEEPNPDLANLLVFVYRLEFDATANLYGLKLARVIPTSSRRLETSFIAGLLGGKVPSREEFDRILEKRLTVGRTL